MAVVNGSGGSVSFGAGSQYDSNVHSFTLSYSEDMLETTAYTATAKTFIGSGVTEWSGTYEAYLDGTAVLAGPGIAAATLTLTGASGRTYAGSAMVSNINLNHTINGLPAVSATFRGTGALTIA